MSGLVRIGTSVFELFTSPDGVMEFQDAASALSYFRGALESKTSISALRAYYFDQTGEAASRRTDHQILAWLSHQVALGRVRIARVGPLARGGSLGEIASLLPEVGTAADTADAAGAAGVAAEAPPIAAIADEKESPTTTDHKIEVKVVNVKGTPQKNLPFEITLPDSSVRIGLTDAKGFAKQGVGPSTGTFTFRLPEQEPAEGAGDDPAVTAGATRIVRGGISLTIDTPAVVEIPPRVFRGRLIGLLFDTDKTFLLPVSLNGIKGLKRFFDRNPGLEVLVVGHADTAGKKQHNLDLSVERAKSIAAYLADDVDFWLAFYPPGRPGSLAWGPTEDKQMLAALGFETVKAFQQDEGLFDDGKAGPDTRRALITRYMKQDDTTLPPGTVVKTHGCGESHPDVPTLDSTPLQANRRVEIFLFEDKIDPPPRDACPSPAGCPEHAIWIARTVQTVDFDEKVGSLKVRVTDDKNNILTKAAVHISGPVTDDGETDDDGDIDFESLPFGTYSIIAQKEGFTPGSGTATVGAPPAARSGNVTVGENSTTIPLKTATGSLVVSVRTSTNKVVVGASVTIDGPVPKSGATDGSGLVTHNDVPAGDYTVTVSDPRFNGPPAAVVKVPPNSSQAHNVVLTAKVTWRITVQDATSTSPVSGAAVQVTGPTTLNGPTDTNGVVSFEAIPTGTYQISVIPNNTTNQNGTQSATVALGPNSTTVLLPAILPTNATVTIANPRVVLVKKPGCTPRRIAVTLRTSQPFPGKGKLEISTPKVRFFPAATGTAPEIAINGTANLFDGAALGSAAGVTIFAEGLVASALMDDITVTLTPQGALGIVSAGTAKMTAVDLTLDVCQSRTAATGFPALLGAGAKADPGRFIHLQDPGKRQGRAMIVVRKPIPASFTGNLVLTPIAAGASGTVQIFAAETPPAGAETPVPANFPISAAALGTGPAILGATGMTFFVEGSKTSAALKDSGVMLGIQGGDPDGDRAVVTVVRLSKLEAEIPSTNAQTVRAPFNNGGVKKSLFTRGAGAAPTATEFDEDFTVNTPLVLVEDSVPAGTPIDLSVLVAPANVPVSWSVLRDTRPGTGAQAGDNAQIVGLKAAPHVPRLTPLGPTKVAAATTPIKSTLLTDAVGSFRIRAYVDGNGNNTFDRDPATAVSFAAEPFILINLLLVRVAPVSNTSAATSTTNPAGPGTVGPGSVTPAAGGGAVSSATGVSVSTGGFVAATAACRNTAQVKVVGGGDDGRRGLNPPNVFGGWVNNELDATTPTRPNASGEDVVSEYLVTSVTPNKRHPRLSVWVRGGGNFGPTAAFTLVPGPVLDTSPFGTDGMGGHFAVGTHGAGAPGPPPPPPGGIAKVNVAASATDTGGELWTINMFDSPGDNCPPVHGAIPAAQTPGTLVSYRFNIDFRSDLCFWTNINANSPQPTPGPFANPTSPRPDPACCLYASVLTNTWNIRFAMTFNPTTGAPVGAIPTVALSMTPEAVAAGMKARPMTAETRFPPVLSLLAIHTRLVP